MGLRVAFHTSKKAARAGSLPPQRRSYYYGRRGASDAVEAYSLGPSSTTKNHALERVVMASLNVRGCFRERYAADYRSRIYWDTGWDVDRYQERGYPQ